RQPDRENAAPRRTGSTGYALRERILPDAHLRALAWKPRDRPLAPRDRLVGQRDTLRWRRGAELGASTDRAGLPRDNRRKAALSARGRPERIPGPAGASPRRGRDWRPLWASARRHAATPAESSARHRGARGRKRVRALRPSDRRDGSAVAP